MMLLRAEMLRTIREHFFQRSVLEVETPLLSQTTGTDPQLDFFKTDLWLPPLRQSLYLQTSPEFAMKRLLAAGSGSIYQIGKAFRNGELGRYHNPEFTLLEWYRVGFGLDRLMDDCDELVRTLFAGHRNLEATERVTYRDVFQHHTRLNPLEFDYQEYCDYAVTHQLSEAIGLCGEDHATWLDLLFSVKVQPHLGRNALCMVSGYPACQPSLARQNSEDSRTTDRVELFIDGVELGNGFFELSDACEQSRRFETELAFRKARHLPIPEKDARLLAALEHGMPDCAGMAIGLDRLLMVRHRQQAIDQVLAFAIDRA